MEKYWEIFCADQKLPEMCRENQISCKSMDLVSQILWEISLGLLGSLGREILVDGGVRVREAEVRRDQEETMEQSAPRVKWAKRYMTEAKPFGHIYHTTATDGEGQPLGYTEHRRGLWGGHSPLSTNSSKTYTYIAFYRSRRFWQMLTLLWWNLAGNYGRKILEIWSSQFKH